MTVDELHRITHIDPWFLHNIKQVVDLEEELKGYSIAQEENVGIEYIQPLQEIQKT